MAVYTSVKDLTLGETYFYETHNRNNEFGMFVTLSNISTNSNGSIYTFDYKSKSDGKLSYFFISSSNKPNPFPSLTEDNTWQKWTEI